MSRRLVAATHETAPSRPSVSTDVRDCLSTGSLLKHSPERAQLPSPDGVRPFDYSPGFHSR